MQRSIDGESDRLRLRDATGQSHRLCSSSRIVEQRSASHIHPGEFAHHGLKAQQHFKATLRDLGLVRGVRRVPGRALEHIAPDHFRSKRGVVPLPDHADHHLVAISELAQPVERLVLAQSGRKVQLRAKPDAVRDRRVEQIIDCLQTNRSEHLRLVIMAWTDVASHERGVGVGSSGVGHVGPPKAESDRKSTPHCPVT